MPIPKFNYDFFNPKIPNVIFDHFDYSRMEFAAIIENYFNNFSVSHPVTVPIVKLLYKLDYYLLMTDEAHYAKLTDEVFYKLDEEIATVISKIKLDLGSSEFNSDDKRFLSSSLDYAKACIERHNDNIKKIYPDLFTKRNEKSLVFKNDNSVNRSLNL